MSAPGVRDLVFVAGDDWSHQITITDGTDPINLTGRTWLAQLRRRSNSATADAAFTVDTTDAATGVLTLTIARAVTAGLSGPYVWDLQQTAADVVTTILAGHVTVRADTSRA